MATVPSRDDLIFNYQNRTLLPFCTEHNLDYEQVLSVAKLENWKVQTPQAHEDTSPLTVSKAITGTTQIERGKQYQQRIGEIAAQKLLPHFESLNAKEILEDIKNIDLADKLARRAFELDTEKAQSGPTLNVQILAQGVEHFAAQVLTAPPIVQ